MSRRVNTWPQVIEQVFSDFDVVEHAAPYWLEVPGTGYRLAVDRLYPQIGIAVWFEGHRYDRRQEDDRTYGLMLSGLCRQAGFSLIAVDASSQIREEKLSEICTALSSSARLIAHLQGAKQVQVTLLPRIAAAKAVCQRIRSEVAASPLPSRPATRWHQRRLRLQASLRQFRSSWQIYAENRLAVLGLVLLFVFALMAVVRPILLATVWPPSIYGADTGFDISIAHPSAPSLKHLLGTDSVGRDVLSVLLASTAPAFVVGLTAALTAAVVGTVIGALAAAFRGGVDAAFMQLADAFLLVPAPLLMIIVGSRFQDMSPAVFGLVYGVVSGVGTTAVVIRSHALTIMNKPFIEAARVSGGGQLHVIVRHLIPHLLPLAAVLMMVTATGAVIADGFVSFLGITRIHHNWGNMIFWSFAYQATVNSTVTWNVLIPPAIAFSLFAASFYFISQGLQRVADPKLRKDWYGEGQD